MICLYFTNFIRDVRLCSETFWGKCDFWVQIVDKYIKFLEKIPKNNKHLFNNYFVHLSIGNSFVARGHSSLFIPCSMYYFPIPKL